jgi:hypothetical protein
MLHSGVLLWIDGLLVCARTEVESVQLAIEVLRRLHEHK